MPLQATILIATYNRASLLDETLASIARMRVSPELSWEVIVVDNHSTDRTRQVVQSHVPSFPVRLRYVFEPKQGRSNALNAGIAAAEGSVLVFTDDDVQVKDGWLDAACGPLLGPDETIAYTGGPIRPIWGAAPPRWLELSRTDLWGTIAIQDHGREPFVYEEGRKVPLGANMAARRSLFDRVGLFRPDLGRTGGRLVLGQEVPELLLRARAAGLRGLYVPAMEISHHVPAARLTRRYFGRWWFGKGVSRALLERMQPITELGLDLRTTPHIAGVPRFLFGNAVRDAVRLAASLLRGRPAAAFRHAMMLAYFAGYLWSRQKPRHSPFLETEHSRYAETENGECHRFLRVAMVAPSLAILGGQAVQAARLLDAWRNDPDVQAWLVPINPTPPRWLRPLTGIKGLRTLVTQAIYWPLLVRELRRADVVHVFSASYWSFLLAPVPAVAIARLLGKPVVLNYRSGEAPDHLQRSAIARGVLRAVDRNAVPSRFLHDVFARFGITSDVIPNIVDARRFAFRRREPLRPRILSVRSFEPMYNIACTLRAFALVQQRHPDATLTLAGAGSQEPMLRQLTAELGLRHVRFAGRVAQDDMWRLYADADIYLQTPDIDNMPSSILEAFASGCVVVSTNAGGVPAILTDGVHGLLVPCGDHDRAAERVLELLERPDLAHRLADAARAACDAYQWDAVRAQWLALYRDLARPAGVPATTPA